MVCNSSISVKSPALAGCLPDDISKGTPSGFIEGAVDSITLASTDTSASTDCAWDLTDIELLQTIPPEQQTDNYNLDLVISVIAN